MDSAAQFELLEERITRLARLLELVQSATATLFSSTRGKSVDLVALMQKAVAESDGIRDDALRSLSAAGVSVEWSDRNSLLMLLRSAQIALAEKQASAALAGIRQLADHLDAGRVAHPRPRLRDERNCIRQKAVEELRVVAAAEVSPLPGPPDAADWLSWFWGAGDAADEAVDSLRGRFPSLAHFLDEVTREQWQPGTSGSAVPIASQDLAASTFPTEEDPRIQSHGVVTDVDLVVAKDRISSQSVSDVSTTSIGPPPLVQPDPAATRHSLGDGLPTEAQEVASEAERPVKDLEAFPLLDQPCDKHLQERSQTATVQSSGTNESVLELVSVSQETDLRPPPILPPDEAKFEEFRKQHWIAPSGACEAAPWRLPGFSENLAEALFRSIEGELFGRAMVFAIAAAELRCDGVPTLEEVEAWARLWQRPREAIGLGSDVVFLLREAAGAGLLDRGRVWKLRLCLEALRPSREQPLSDGEARRWVDTASFSSGSLREMLVLLLRVGRATGHPIDEIHRVRRATGPEFDDLAQILEDKRKEFHSEVRRVWSAAGGMIGRTHCRRAWDEFITKIKPTVEALYPVGVSGKDCWDPDEFKRRIERFPKVHKEIADRWDAKKKDRQTMDRTAELIATRAAEINDLYQKKKATEEEQRTRPVSDEEMLRLTEAFIGDNSRSDAFEDCCRRLINRHIELRTETEPSMGLTASDLLAYPALLGCVANGQTLSPGSAGEEIIPISDVVLPHAAAAVLLQPAGPTTTLGQGEKLVDRLASLLLPLKRHDLLAPLANDLASPDQARLRAARNDLLAETMKVYGEFRRTWERLGDLAALSMAPASLKDALDDAVRRMKTAPPGEAARPVEQLLFKGWLERLALYATRLLSHFAESFKQSVQAEAHPDKINIIRAIDDERYADAVFLRSEAAGVKSKPEVARRQTLWRKVARKRFTDPSETLKSFRFNLKQFSRGNSDLDELIGKWLAGVTGSLSEDQRLRTKFADVVFADTFGGEGEQLRSQGKSERSHFWIPCQKVREYLARQGLNPSFLPQLANAEELVFVTPPAKVSDPGLVHQTANLIAGSHSNKLVAILAPGISTSQRTALLHELRQRKLTAKLAGVVDGLDFCRLLNAGGRRIDLVIGLMELLLEQQRWVDQSPFHAHDGAQARIEMYVGRGDEAKVLATDNKYSRLFSGRKLGKSALLKFVEEKYDGSRLPSGNVLRVLRIPIVGIQSDAMVVNKVLTELRDHLDFQRTVPGDNTVDAFLNALTEFLKVRPEESLLVILDEADVFVEKQLDEYDLHKERCFTFRIRSDAQKDVDRQGLPRVRFVFAGYRKANTRGGAWGNWGDPLLLNPLQADEAAELIAGPLARLGIDAAEAAPSIAYRCGYQPAVLLRFGERLLDIFDNRFPDVADRDHVIVTAAHVAEVYQHQAVQDEIRTVVRNNFQGNDAGQAVFSAALLAFANLAPGDALVNAPERIWERLRELVQGDPSVAQAAASIEWLAPRDPDGGRLTEGAEVRKHRPSDVGLNEIKKHLEDFVERKLLILVNRDDGVFRLRFPYHLSSLLVGVQDEAWAALRRLGRGASGGGDDQRAGDPLSPPTLRDLESVVRKYGDLGLQYRAAVLGTLWPQSVASPDWLANRLGFDPARLSHPGQPRDSEAAAFLEINAVDAQALLKSRPADAPPALLLGGVDLLRWGLFAVQGGEAIDVHGQGRLGRAAVGRWFQRTREFGFDRDGLEQICRFTGCIPYFVCLFDKCLREAVEADGGVHVGPEEFARASTKYERKLPEYASRLASGADAVRLAAREAELLLMVTVAARATDFKHPIQTDDLARDWEEGLYDEQWTKDFSHRPYPAAWSESVEDRLAAKLVTDLGLLPHPLDRRPVNGTLTPEDPLVKVIVPALARVGG